MDPATITAIATALASTVALLITSLRKRQDTTVEELRNARREEEMEHADTKEELRLEKEVTRTLRDALRLEQNHNIKKERIIARLRRELARHDIDDPTADQSSVEI